MTRVAHSVASLAALFVAAAAWAQQPQNLEPLPEPRPAACDGHGLGVHD